MIKSIFLIISDLIKAFLNPAGFFPIFLPILIIFIVSSIFFSWSFLFRDLNSNDFLKRRFVVVVDRQRKLSDDWLFSQVWNRNWNLLCSRYSLEDWILNVLNIILHVIFLNDRLSYNLFSFNVDNLFRNLMVKSWSLNYWF